MKIYLVPIAIVAVKISSLLSFLLTGETTISSSVFRDVLPYTVEIGLPDSTANQTFICLLFAL